MGMMRELIHYFFQKDLIRHSNKKKILTKYGIFQAKIYKDGQHEFLVIMSRDFFELETPIVYSYSESHNCDTADHEMCYCNHQIDAALKMIHNEGGAIVYYSQDVRNIDGLLQELNVRALDSMDEVMTKATVKQDLKTYEKEFQSIGFIFKDLSLSRIKLITHDINLVHISQKLGIKIIKRVTFIQFDYGELG
ncbi:MAG: Unknown protein [uncultured Sulfurovum sp.]|uniref:GTP cyclohydrolase II domain-containing protein n=1 Tax=uncultured Sulfurovum sp. TaxID=269237 RepID=A0A6S6SNA1_9BACT|nr:MAG: Unknown protein [uncultured Sulfurovum sp.]